MIVIPPMLGADVAPVELSAALPAVRKVSSGFSTEWIGPMGGDEKHEGILTVRNELMMAVTRVYD